MQMSIILVLSNMTSPQILSRFDNDIPFSLSFHRLSLSLQDIFSIIIFCYCLEKDQIRGISYNCMMIIILASIAKRNFRCDRKKLDCALETRWFLNKNVSIWITSHSVHIYLYYRGIYIYIYIISGLIISYTKNLYLTYLNTQKTAHCCIFRITSNHKWYWSMGNMFVGSFFI